MGMSDDFEIAIEEGATGLVRHQPGLFGAPPLPDSHYWQQTPSRGPDREDRHRHSPPGFEPGNAGTPAAARGYTIEYVDATRDALNTRCYRYC